MLFSARWETVFLRVYDMCDVLVRVPRRSDFAPFRHLVDGSVEFDIDLPDVVRGDINPQTDSAAALRHLFAR
jgi:hypothetical protein